MTRQEAIDGTIILLQQIVEDAQDAATELAETDSIRDIKIYAEDLMAFAQKIYRLAIRLETLEAVENLDNGKEQR
jgi:hypothetical protein